MSAIGTKQTFPFAPHMSALLCELPPKVETGPQPPFYAVLLLRLLAGKSLREAEGLLGDMEEIFARDFAMFGLPRARFLYCVNTLRSLWPLVKRIIVWATFISRFL